MKNLFTIFVVLCLAVCTTFADTGKVEKLQSEIQNLNKQISKLQKTVELQRAEIERLKTLCQKNGIALSPKKRIKKLTYTIIDTDIIRGIKRSLDVRLNRKVSQDELRSIAIELKNKDPKEYERTFICYYLPDMKVDAGAWATTHFNPNLEVKILGFTVEQEKALKQQHNDPSREVIGSWLDESPFIGKRYTIFRQNGKLFMEYVYEDGGTLKREIVEKLSDKGRTFRKNEDNSREFYLIDSQGNLQVWDWDQKKEVLVTTAKKIGG